VSFASDIFSIRVKQKSSPRKYRVTWPCGSTWDYDRFDLDVPVYENGKQNGVCVLADTLAEMATSLAAHGGKVELLPRDSHE